VFEIKIGRFFETKRRAATRPGEEGDPFVSLTDDRPEWLHDAVREAHGGGSDLPNDWIYQECQAAAELCDDRGAELAAEDGDGDVIHEHADGRVDVYTRDRFQWAADLCLSTVYALAEDEAEGMPTGEALSDRIGVIQFYAIQSITRTIVDAWRKACEDADGDDEDAAEGS